MADKSKIEWTDASWTPIRARNLTTRKVGWHCEHATTGCEFCYAEGMNRRLGTGLPYKPGHRKDIEIFLDEKMLLAPLRWKRPRMVFVCSMTDLFADFVQEQWIDRIFAVMALCPQHTFQVLTKRAERMRDYCSDVAREFDGALAAPIEWPLPNMWAGVSAERQQEAAERIPYLLETPALVRFVSAEPLLGPIDFGPFFGSPIVSRYGTLTVDLDTGLREWEDEEPPQILRGLDWLIVGGESGPRARQMSTQWACDLRDQCKAAGVPCFFKQMPKKGTYPG